MWQQHEVKVAQPTLAYWSLTKKTGTKEDHADERSNKLSREDCLWVS